MPGQEKMVMEYYQKNPSAAASLRGSIYEDKIIKLIKNKAKANKKDITKNEAENILKAENEKNVKKKIQFINKDDKKVKKTTSSKKSTLAEKPKSSTIKTRNRKKVSKK